MLTLAIGLALMGLTYGPLGTVLSELFPTAVRYTGSSLTFNLAGIFGASLAPYIATSLANTYGLQYVGYYLTGAALLSLVGLADARNERRGSDTLGFGLWALGLRLLADARCRRAAKPLQQDSQSGPPPAMSVCPVSLVQPPAGMALPQEISKPASAPKGRPSRNG